MTDTQTPNRFTKIANAKNVHIEWQSKKTTASKAEELHQHQLDCPERPRPAFGAALQRFLAFALQIIGAPDTWAENTRVTGVSINYEEDGRRGLVITMSRKGPLGAAPFVINTPHLREPMDPTKETGVSFFPTGLAGVIDFAAQEAQAYLDGDRAQADMFAEGDAAKTRGGKPEKVGDVLDFKSRQSGERAD